MNLIKIITLLIACIYYLPNTYGQANPNIAIQPSNAGIVVVGGTIDLIITIGNTDVGGIPVSKLRPVITLPPSVNFKSTLHQTGIPLGWSILTNNPTQLRLCNTSDVIQGFETRTIILKVEGVTVAPASFVFGQLNFGNGGSTCAAGPQVAGNNPIDDNSSTTIQVVSPCGLMVTATAGFIQCNAGNTTVTAASTGVAGAVEYSINGGAYQSSNLFTGIVAGNYIITGRQVSNLFCTNSTTLIISEPTEVQVPIINIVQPSCTVATGTVSITSATTSLTFSIDGSASFTSYSGPITFTTGGHTIRARNSDGCLSPIASFTINPQPITPATPILGAITQPNCSVSTGSSILSGLPTGNWTVNPGNILGNTSNTTLNNLPAGTYNYTVTNNVGCTSLPTADVVINAVAGAPAAPIVSVTQPTCLVSTGSIIVTSTATGLTFSLDNTAYIPYPAGGFTNVASGNHTLIVQNISGCLSPFTNIIINPQPASPAPAIVMVTQPNCTISTGSINVTSDTTGLTFSLDGAAFTSYPASGYTLVSVGIHHLRVQNNSGCTPSVTNNIIVNAQPTTPVVSASASTITCFGGSSTLTVLASGGELPYEFSLNNSGSFQANNTFNVGAGTYFVNVKGANGCTTITNNVVIAQPTAIIATLTAGTIACSGGNTSLTVSATGGTGLLEYSLNNSPNFQASNVFNNLTVGNYSVRVRPVASIPCITTTTTVIVTQPDSLKAIITALPINQCGGTTIVNVLARGGKAPFTGTGNFTRGPGTWIFSITDANGCVASSQITILPPGCVDIRVFPNPAQNSITVNHPAATTLTTIQVKSINGATVLSKSISQNAFMSFLNISTLASGTYILVYINGKEKKEIKFIKANGK